MICWHCTNKYVVNNIYTCKIDGKIIPGDVLSSRLVWKDCPLNAVGWYGKSEKKEQEKKETE